jgi:hypothetical protein
MVWRCPHLLRSMQEDVRRWLSLGNVVDAEDSPFKPVEESGQSPR